MSLLSLLVHTANSFTVEDHRTSWTSQRFVSSGGHDIAYAVYYKESSKLKEHDEEKEKEEEEEEEEEEEDDNEDEEESKRGR